MKEVRNISYILLLEGHDTYIYIYSVMYIDFFGGAEGGRWTLHHIDRYSPSYTHGDSSS